MRGLIVAGTVLCGVFGSCSGNHPVSQAYAQATKRPPKDISLFNCSAVRNSPYVCVSNESDDIVTDMDCKTKGFFGGSHTKGVEMPKGGLPAHSLTIVKFPSCKGHIVFTVLGGGERETGDVDTDTASLIEVPRR